MRKSVAIAAVILLALAGFRPDAQAADSGVMDALAPTIEARLPQWVAAWKAASPEFNLRSFRLTLLKAVAEAWLPEAYDPGSLHEEFRRKLYVISPDGGRAIYPYATLSFVTREGTTRAGIGTDAGVMLIDFAARRAMWLGQCDLACGFHEAAWLANDRAVVAGYEIDLNDPNCPRNRLCRSVPEILIYDFSRRNVMLFKGPAVPGGVSREYVVRRIQETLPSVFFD